MCFAGYFVIIVLRSRKITVIVIMMTSLPVDHQTPNRCLNGLNDCLELAKELGGDIEQLRNFFLQLVCLNLGFILDSVLLELNLPQGKLWKVRQTLKPLFDGKSGTKCKLLSLIGLLQHYCQAITHGCPFLSRLIDKATATRKLHHLVRLHNGRRMT